MNHRACGAHHDCASLRGLLLPGGSSADIALLSGGVTESPDRSAFEGDLAGLYT